MTHIIIVSVSRFGSVLHIKVEFSKQTHPSCCSSMGIFRVDYILLCFIVREQFEPLAQKIISELLDPKEYCWLLSFVRRVTAFFVAQSAACDIYIYGMLLPLTFFWQNTLLIVLLDASVATMNGFAKSGYARTDDEVSAVVNSWNDCCILSAHSNAIFSEVFRNRRISIFANPSMNLL